MQSVCCSHYTFEIGLPGGFKWLTYVSDISSRSYSLSLVTYSLSYINSPHYSILAAAFMPTQQNPLTASYRNEWTFKMLMDKTQYGSISP